jgi:hypothetical protein
MFGMLDYRAHKLYRLLTFPFHIIILIIFFSAIAVGIMVARSTEFAWWAKIIIAYLVFELAVIIGNLLFKGLLWLFNSAFFWTVDVVPSKGSDHEEARVIVLWGELRLLAKKLESKIEDWTEEDTVKLLRYAPWRCRLFFRKNIIERFRARVRFIQQYYEETGVRLGELPSSKSDELLKPYKDPWYERALASTSIVDLLIASVFILMFTNA